MFEMSMSVNQEIVYGVIDILVELNWLDKELYQKEKVLWSDKFMDSIRAVYINRKRPVPTKDNFYGDSTGRNESIVEYSREENSKEEKREEKKDSLLSVEQYEELFPQKDVNKSFKKFLDYEKNHTHSKAMGWLENEKALKPLEFKKPPNADYYIAYCDECDNQEFPKDEWAIKRGSACCKAEYRPTRKKSDELRAKSDV